MGEDKCNTLDLDGSLDSTAAAEACRWRLRVTRPTCYKGCALCGVREAPAANIANRSSYPHFHILTLVHCNTKYATLPLYTQAMRNRYHLPIHHCASIRSSCVCLPSRFATASFPAVCSRTAFTSSAPPTPYADAAIAPTAELPSPKPPSPFAFSLARSMSCSTAQLRYPVLLVSQGRFPGSEVPGGSGAVKDGSRGGRAATLLYMAWNSSESAARACSCGARKNDRCSRRALEWASCAEDARTAWVYSRRSFRCYDRRVNTWEVGATTRHARPGSASADP